MFNCPPAENQNRSVELRSMAFMQTVGILVLHDSIGGSGSDLISGGKRVGELH